VSARLTDDEIDQRRAQRRKGLAWRPLVSLALLAALLVVLVLFRGACAKGTATIFQQMFPPPPPDAGTGISLPPGWKPLTGDARAALLGPTFEIAPLVPVPPAPSSAPTGH